MVCPVCEKVVLEIDAARVPFCLHRFHVECLVRESLRHGTSKEQRRTCSRCPRVTVTSHQLLATPPGGETLDVSSDLEFAILLDHLLSVSGELLWRCLQKDQPLNILNLASEGMGLCDDLAIWGAVAGRHVPAKVRCCRELLATLKAYTMARGGNMTLTDDLKKVLCALEETGRALYVVMLAHRKETSGLSIAKESDGTPHS